MTTTTQAAIDTAIRFHLRAATAHDYAASTHQNWCTAQAETQTEAAQAALGSLVHEYCQIDRLADECQWASDGGMHASAALSHRAMASALAML